MLCPSVAGLLLDVTVIVVWIRFSICVNTGEVLPAKVESPEYFAVMEWEPRASPPMVICAVPPEGEEAPIGLAPSKKITVPVGKLPEEEWTVAVKVMF